MGKRAILGGLAAVAAAYLAYPYVTLLALQLSVEHGSPAVIEPFVAWDSVREGIKEDICDDAEDAGAVGVTQAASAATALPAFGSGFVRAIKANIVDTAITPDSMGDMLRGMQGPGGLTVNWAFFDGPHTFVVELARQHAAANEELFKLRLDLEGGVWRITRAWLPHWMLERAAAART